MSGHKNLTGTDIHRPYAWSYANSTARTGASGFVAADVGKLAYQEDDDTLWILTATTPTWQAVGKGTITLDDAYDDGDTIDYSGSNGCIEENFPSSGTGSTKNSKNVTNRYQTITDPTANDVMSMKDSLGTPAVLSYERWYENGVLRYDFNTNNFRTYDVSHIISDDPSDGGGLVTKTSNTTSGAMSGATHKIEVNIPSGAVVIGVQLRVDTAVTGPTTFIAAYSGGLTQAIGPMAVAKNTKLNLLYDTNADTALCPAETDITLTAVVDNFTGGVVRAIVYYEEWLAMDDAS